MADASVYHDGSNVNSRPSQVEWSVNTFNNDNKVNSKKNFKDACCSLNGLKPAIMLRNNDGKEKRKKCNQNQFFTF
jgi:hypothetical protein